MPFQWKTGQPPAHLVPKKVLILGPDEMYDSDYPFVKKVLDEFTLKLEHFEVVVLGDGKKKEFRGPPCGTDMVVLKWCDHYKLTRHMLPIGNYDSGKERNRDLRNTLGERGVFCCWFRDDSDSASEWVYNQVVREVVSPKRTKIVRI